MRLILLLLLTLNLLQAQKIALLIGNGDYDFSPLKNPTHDVDGIAKTLKEIGFKSSDVKVLKNASKTKMEKALAAFSQKAQSADIALIYFSGHGMQVNNTNYMLPARTNPKKPVDLYGLVDLDYFIQSATSAKYGIVLVDACRDNPLVKYFDNGKRGSVKKGLGQVTPSAGQVVIGFATSAGDTADDGRGSMSPYATALQKRLKTPNKDITKVLGLVALDVSKTYSQNPIYRANLAYDVYLYRVQEKVNLEPQSYTIATPVVHSLPPSTTLNWINPSNTICRNNGGSLNYDTCLAEWPYATNICRLSGGRLPNIDELKNIITDCAGEIIGKETPAGISPNLKNSAYQVCYKEKGFISSGYWSSTSQGKKRWSAWSAAFDTAWVGHDTKNYHYYIRCIKSE